MFRQFLADRRCERVITVVGDGNAGKTAFLDASLRYARSAGIRTCHWNLKGSTPLSTVFDRVRRSFDEQLLPRFFRATASQADQALFEDLRQLSEPILFVIDHFEQGAPEVKDLLTQSWLPLADQFSLCRFLIGGREVPSSQGEGWTHDEHRLERSPIPLEDWYSYTQRVPKLKILSREQLETIVSLFAEPGTVAGLIHRLAAKSAGGGH